MWRGVTAIQAEGHYTRLYEGQESHFCPWPISKVEESVAGRNFMRTHRSFLVNLEHARAFQRKHDKVFLVVPGPEDNLVPVSRGHRARSAQGAGALTPGPVTPAALSPMSLEIGGPVDIRDEPGSRRRPAGHGCVWALEERLSIAAKCANQVKCCGACSGVFRDHRHAEPPADHRRDLLERHALLSDGVIAPRTGILLQREAIERAASNRCTAGQRLRPSPI